MELGDRPLSSRVDETKEIRSSKVGPWMTSDNEIIAPYVLTMSERLLSSNYLQHRG